jgi:hypothetical protein
MDDESLEALLDQSDELHIEILGFLETAQPFPGLRFEAGLVACGVAFEHAISLRMLLRCSCITSAFSLVRLQYEALTRAVWLLYAATDLQVAQLTAPLSPEAETSARKMPMFSKMLEEVVQKAPPQAYRMLGHFKDVNWHAMNSYVHSGIHPLRRHAEGYPAQLIHGVILSSNGLSMMTLMAGKILTGDAGAGAAVQAMQEKYKAVLPGLPGLVEPPENAERK